MRPAKHLLLVDDDKNSREGYRIYLSAKGFHVDALGGGEDALAFAKSSSPDLVVLDLGLPDVDGWEVARRLRSDKQTRDIPIIAFSGRSMHHEQVSALRAGCDVHLTKPCEPDRLLGAIKKLLGMTEKRVSTADAGSDPY
jgi:DNA-binding response OmpR family regulator